jgi:hypothetical protein
MFNTMKNYILFFLCLCGFIAFGQHSAYFYCDAMVNAIDGKNRMEAVAQFNKQFKADLEAPNSFNKTFSEYKWISIKGDTSKTFRIITWQVKDDENNHFQYGYVQKSTGELFTLKDAIHTIDKDSEYSLLTPDDWYGALYYNLKEIKVKGAPAYLLFGYDANNDRDRVKIADVLSFENGKPVFGKEFFNMNDPNKPDIKSRIILDYTNVSNVSLNYNQDLEMIMYDHLATVKGVAQDGGPARIADGTYSGFEWKGNQWMFVDKIANEISEPKDIYSKIKPAPKVAKKKSKE